jgi:hypothetical protein
MSLVKFSFKLEPMWIWLFSLAPVVIGLLVALAQWQLR